MCPFNKYRLHNQITKLPTEMHYKYTLDRKKNKKHTGKKRRPVESARVINHLAASKVKAAAMTMK